MKYIVAVLVGMLSIFGSASASFEQQDLTDARSELVGVGGQEIVVKIDDLLNGISDVTTLEQIQEKIRGKRDSYAVDTSAQGVLTLALIDYVDIKATERIFLVKRMQDSEWMVEYYDTGEKYKEGLVNSELDEWVGKVYIYHKNGVLEVVLNFESGYLDGTFVGFDENGKKEKEIVYDKSQVIRYSAYKEYVNKTGDSQYFVSRVSYYEDGDIVQTKKYYDDGSGSLERDAYYTDYEENTGYSLYFEKEYSYVFYTRVDFVAGNTVTTAEYTRDKRLIVKRWYENGLEVKRVIYNRDGSIDSTITFDENGKPQVQPY